MVCEGSLATGPACGQYGSSGAARTHFAIAAWDGGGRRGRGDDDVQSAGGGGGFRGRGRRIGAAFKQRPAAGQRHSGCVVLSGKGGQAPLVLIGRRTAGGDADWSRRRRSACDWWK